MQEILKTYKPRKSIGGYFLGGLLVLIILSSIGLFLPFFADFSNQIGVFIIMAPTWVILIIVTTFFLIIYPTMKYELSDDELKLKCGPFKRKIPLSTIKNIYKKNLKPPISSTAWKMPGYGLFPIEYPDDKWITMYSRSIQKDILLIETSMKKYGITPADEDEFLEDLKERMDKISNGSQK